MRKTQEPEFAVDLAVQLALPGKKDTEQAFSRILGWKVGRFVLVELPSREGRAVEVRTGTPCVVRYMLDGRVVGFATTIARVQFTPDPLLFLEYPKAIEVQNLRRQPRVTVDLAVVINIEGTEGRIRGRVCDLSKSGCGITIGERSMGLEIDTRVVLFVRFLKLEDVRPILAVIRKKTPAKKDAVEAKLGVEFMLDANDPTHLVLDDLLERGGRDAST